MYNVIVDFSKKTGVIKPMHAVNNGPISNRNGSNAEYFKNAGIPYARLHDSNYAAAYGGPHTVDIHSVFPDFDKDPFDPENYDFVCTDMYIKSLVDAGVEPFYRLGESIEHAPKKYNIFPPKDNLKWAQICEGVIRHYTEGWADGFHYEMKYWEIWNEPDTGYKECNSPTWRGTMNEFFAMFKTALVYLKGKFPHLRIGGPALCSVTDSRDILEDMMTYLTEGERAPLDFFSWHMYGNVPKEEFTRKVRIVDEVLKKYGYTDTESILNEWNYVKAWDNMYETFEVVKGLKGSSFTSAAMTTCQREGLDMLMYYDARLCNYNGLFDTVTLRPLKGYYPFYMFNKLYELKTAISTETDNDDICVCGASDGNCGRVMLTYYNVSDDAPDAEIKLSFSGIFDISGVKLSVYTLDAYNDAQLTREETFCGDTFATVLCLKNYTTILVEVER